MSCDSLELRGFVEIEETDEHGNVITKQHNTITGAGKRLMLGLSAGELLNFGYDTGGKSASVSPFVRIAGSNPTIIKHGIQDSVGIGLLNLGPDAAKITENSSCLPIMRKDDLLIDNSKIVGIGTESINSNAAGKLGSMIPALGKFWVDGRIVTNRWEFRDGVATGTIDTVVIAHQEAFKDPICPGVANFINISNCMLEPSNVESKGTGMLPPGIPGYTGNDEVLLDFERDGIKQWKLNINTGIYTPVNEGEPFMVWPLRPGNGSYDSGYSDYLVDGEYVYTVEYIDGYSSYNWYRVWHLEGGVLTKIYETNLNYGSPCSLSLLKHNGKMYVFSAGSSYANVYEFSPDESGIYKTGATYWDKSEIETKLSITLPPRLKTKECLDSLVMKSYGDKYMIGLNNDILKIKDTDTGLQMPLDRMDTWFIFSSMADICGSISDCINLPGGALKFSNPQCSGAFSGKLTQGGNFTDPYNRPEKTKIYNKSNTDGQEINKAAYGIKMTKAGWNGNLISFAKLEKPIDKPANKNIKVTYGYEVV